MADLLGIYLNDHLTGATGGVALARRIAATHSEDAAASDTAWLAQQIEEDRRSLVTIMTALGIGRRPAKNVLGLVGERIGRLKLNGTLVRRSPLSDVIEFEGLRLAVEGKAAGWRTLQQLADHDKRIDTDTIAELLARAKAQSARVERLRRKALLRAFADAHDLRRPAHT